MSGESTRAERSPLDVARENAILHFLGDLFDEFTVNWDRVQEVHCDRMSVTVKWVSFEPREIHMVTRMWEDMVRPDVTR